MAYKAYTRNQAMEIASAVIGADMLGKDQEATEREGMPVYIYEDGSRLYDGSALSRPVISLEIDKGPEGMIYENIDILPLKSMEDVEGYVDAQASLVCIRTYERGCSHDRWHFNADQMSRYALRAIMFGAIKAYMSGHASVQDAANVAEFQAMQLGLDKANLYDTVYNPVKYAPIDKVKK